MDLTGEYTIPASREAVWKALNDVDVLKVCVPGCQEMEKTSDTEFSAVATIKIGAVKATFKGAVTLSDIDPPNGYTIQGQGQGGVAGFAKGGARVNLTDGPDGSTILTYTADAQLGGKLAAVGSRMIQGISKKMADDFFACFAKQLGAGMEQEEGVEPPTAPSAEAPAAEAAPAAKAAAAPAETAAPVSGRDLAFLVAGVILGGLVVYFLAG